MVAQLREALTGRFRMLEREAAKTALDLNVAVANHQDLTIASPTRIKRMAFCGSSYMARTSS